MKNKILLFSSLMYAFSLFAQDLERHQWQDRVILLFAERETDSVLQEQLTLLTENAAEVTDRDLVIYQIFRDEVKNPGGKKLNGRQSDAFFKKYQVRRDGFTFILVGKDGGEKLRSEALVPLEKLFGRIDRMPMRRAEMRRKRDGGE